MTEVKRIDLGAVSAYALAVEKGYAGTEEEFVEILTNALNYATQAQVSASAAAGSAEEAGRYKTQAGEILADVNLTLDDVKNEVYEFDLIEEYPDCVNGSLSTTGVDSHTGELNYVRSGYFLVEKGTVFKRNGYDFTISTYESQSLKTFISSTGYISHDYVVREDCYARIAVKSDTDFPDTNISKYINAYTRNSKIEIMENDLTNIKNKFVMTLTENDIKWEHGGYSATGTTTTSSRIRSANSFLALKDSKFIVPSGYKLFIYYLDDVITSTEIRVSQSPFVLTESKEIRIVLANTANDNLKDTYADEFAKNFDISIIVEKPERCYKQIVPITIQEYSGTIDTTPRNNYSEIIAKWDTLMSEFPNNISKRELGFDASGTYTIYAYEINSKTDEYITPQSEYSNKKILWISCVHGAESTVAEADYRMFESILKDNAFAQNYLYGNAVFEIIPVANPWGMDNHQRYNSNSVNINRNFPSSDWKHISVEEDYYNASGDVAGDQAETQIIMNFIEQNKDAILCVNRHQSESLTSGKVISYIKSKLLDNRTLARYVFGELTSLSRKTCPWLYDIDSNALKNLFNVKETSSLTGTMDSWYNENGINGFLYESANNLGDDYADTDGSKYKDMWKINMTTMISLLYAFTVNADYLNYD